MIKDQEDVIKDLEKYLSRCQMNLSASSRELLLEVENIAKTIDNPPFEEVYLLGILRKSNVFRNIIELHGGNYKIADELLFKDAIDCRDEIGKYVDGEDLYSDIDHRGIGCRTGVIDAAIKHAQSCSRKELLDVDIIEGLLSYHDDIFPIWDNGQWTDEKLRIPFNTLAHILGHYEGSLWIKFEDIRRDLNITKGQKLDALLQLAPPKTHDSLKNFLLDHADYHKNCFLIMSFAETVFHKEINNKLKEILAEYGFNLLRADECFYNDELLANVETYIYGCGFAIAVFERVRSDNFNPNVSYEVGYLSGLNKPVCYLKEKTLPYLQSDLIGKLYYEFDLENISDSLCESVTKWLKNKKLIK